MNHRSPRVERSFEAPILGEGLLVTPVDGNEPVVRVIRSRRVEIKRGDKTELIETPVSEPHEGEGMKVPIFPRSIVFEEGPQECVAASRVFSIGLLANVYGSKSKVEPFLGAALRRIKGEESEGFLLSVPEVPIEREPYRGPSLRASCLKK